MEGRLSIDEVLGHCNRTRERHEKMSSMEELEKGDMEPYYMKEYWEHRQVAEWLTELKEYRGLGTPEQLREVDGFYLRKCQEVNQLRAQLATLKKMVPPCRIGREAYFIRTYEGRKIIRQGVISELFFREDMTLIAVVKNIGRGVIGKDVFLTYEEAEKAKGDAE